MSQRICFWLGLALMGAAILLLFDSPVVFAKSPLGFVFDDLPVIFYNRQLQSSRLIEAMSWNPFRTTVYFSYWLQIQLQLHGVVTFGDAVLFRVVNLLLHWLAGMVLLLTGRALWPERKAAASLAALFFWLNPIFAEAKYFILGRTEIMLTIFYLLALLFYLQSRRSIFCRSAFFLTLLLALFCKEVAATIPAAALLLSLYKAEKPRWIELAGGSGLVALFIILRLGWTVELAKTPKAVPAWPTFFLNQNWIFWFAALKTLIPFHQSFDYNPHNHPALAAALLVFNLLALGFIIWKSIRGWRIGWLLLVYPLLYLPLAVIPLADSLRESRLYLPGAWLILICALAIAPAFAQPKKSAWAFALIAMFCLWGLASERARVWNSEARLWADALQKSPDKFRPAYNYASSLRRKLKLERAKKIYLWAKNIEPDNPKLHWALALIEEAEKHPEKIERLKRQLEENSGTR